MQTKKTQAFSSFLQFLGTIVDRFGWPGALLAIWVAEFETHATPEQHHELIDIFLGHGTGTFWPVATLGVLFVAVSLAQRHHYGRKVEMLTHRIDELVREKTGLHEALIGRPLRHAAELEEPTKPPPPPTKPPPPAKGGKKPPKSK